MGGASLPADDGSGWQDASPDDHWPDTSGCPTHARNTRNLLPEDLPAVDLARQFQIWRDLGANEHHLGFPIRWVLIAADGSQAMEWMASGEHRQLESIPQPLKGAHIRPLETRHSVPSCAWSVSTEAKVGRFDRDRVDRLGLDATQRRTLANGAPIELEDGTHLRPEDLRGPERPGRCIVVSGDTGANPPGYQSVDHPVDLLVHEATFLEEHRQAPIDGSTAPLRMPLKRQR